MAVKKLIKVRELRSSCSCSSCFLLSFFLLKSERGKKKPFVVGTGTAVYPPDQSRRNRKHDDYSRCEKWCLQCLTLKSDQNRTYLTGRVVDEEEESTPKKSKSSSSKNNTKQSTAAATAAAAAQCEFCFGTSSSPPSESSSAIEKYTCNANHAYNVCIPCHAGIQKQFAKWKKQAMKFNLKQATTITKNGTVLLSPQFRGKSIVCSRMMIQ